MQRLGVRDIVVCGHSHCGAIQALYADPLPDAPHMNRWLDLARDAALPVTASEEALRQHRAAVDRAAARAPRSTTRWCGSASSAGELLPARLVLRDRGRAGAGARRGERPTSRRPTSRRPADGDPTPNALPAPVAAWRTAGAAAAARRDYGSRRRTVEQSAATYRCRGAPRCWIATAIALTSPSSSPTAGTRSSGARGFASTRGNSRKGASTPVRRPKRRCTGSFARRSVFFPSTSAFSAVRETGCVTTSLSTGSSANGAEATAARSRSGICCASRGATPTYPAGDRPPGVRRVAVARLLDSARERHRVQARGLPAGARRARALPACAPADPPRAPVRRPAPAEMPPGYAELDGGTAAPLAARGNAPEHPDFVGLRSFGRLSGLASRRGGRPRASGPRTCFARRPLAGEGAGAGVTSSPDASSRFPCRRLTPPCPPGCRARLRTARRSA